MRARSQISSMLVVSTILLILIFLSPLFLSGIFQVSSYSSALEQSTAFNKTSTSSQILNAHLSNVEVSPNCYFESNAETEEAVDPVNGYIYVVWIGCGGIGFARSTDGGSTFGPAFPIEVNTAYRTSWDPSIAISQSGIVYVGYMIGSATPSEANGGIPVVAASFDHGATFPQVSNVSSSPSNQFFGDRDFLAIAPNGAIYVTWDYSPNASIDSIACPPGGSCYFLTGDYNIVIANSTDGGKTWSSQTPIDREYPHGGGVAAPLLVEPNGQIDILYEDYNISVPSNTLEMGFNYFTTSNDNGKTWSPRIAIGASEKLELAPNEWWIDGTISRDSSGTLYASWDTPNSTSDNAWVSFSTDDGKNWSAPAQMNPDEPTSAHIEAAVVGAGNGLAYVAWMSNDTNGEWSSYFREFSTVNGFLTPSIRVSSSLGIKGIWGGDTIGLASLSNGRAAISWGFGVQTLRGNHSEIFETEFAPFSNVSFTETGLQAGVAWGVTLGGSTVMSTGNSLTFSNVLVGSYAWNSSFLPEGVGTRIGASVSSGVLNVNSDSVQSLFYEEQYEVSILSGGNGTVSPSGTNWYGGGSTISLTANPKAGYSFSGWSSNTSSITFGNSGSASTTATIEGPGTIVGRFTASLFSYYLYVAIASGIIVVTSLVFFYRRKRSLPKARK